VLIRLALAGTRVFLGLIFFSSGTAKLTHGDFFGIIGPVWLADRLAPYGLGLWAEFVAWSQVLIGLLLLSQRFAVIGAIMLVPMLANIFMITVSLQWRGTPYVNAVLLAMNGFLLWGERHRLKLLFIDDDPAARSTVVRRSSPKLDLLALAGIAIAVIGPSLYPLHRRAPYATAAIALTLFAVAAWKGRVR
jgi:uncharacterized membrane protein YphA (DoxX/SURF4 family)